ncbi:MAG: hypothetical protein PVI98_07940 [Burkholderiales bacterium]|jgi:hypothetical protein
MSNAFISRGLRAGIVAAVLVVAGCASVQQPLRDDLVSDDAPVQQCARWFRLLDKVVAQAGVNDVQARPVEGFPYLRVDRFTAALGAGAAASPRAFDAWVNRMQLLDEQGRQVEISNLPQSAIGQLGVSDRQSAVARTTQCAQKLAAANLGSDAATRALLEQRAHVADDYSSVERTLGLYAFTRVPFKSGIKDWHDEANEAFERARSGAAPAHPQIRYVPPAATGYSRKEVAALLERSTDALGVPVLTAHEREQLFATYAPVFAVETTGDYDRIGRLVWSTSPSPQVDTSRPTVYRKLAYTLDGKQTLLQLVYVAWMPERPKKNSFDMLGGHLDGTIWRVTLAPDGEPLVYDAIHPCGCFHMFFPTPRAVPVPAPDPNIEWAFAPATLPAIPETSRITVSVQTRTHYLDNVWPQQGQTGVEYVFADYDSLRTLPLPEGGARSIFGPAGLVPGTQRAERYYFWPMGIASAGAMRQWGTHATAFLGRRHFDDADLMEKRFRLSY